MRLRIDLARRQRAEGKTLVRVGRGLSSAAARVLHALGLARPIAEGLPQRIDPAQARANAARFRAHVAARAAMGLKAP